MTRFEKWAVWTTVALTAATGGVYFWMKYLMTSPDPYAVIHHPWQPIALKLHILVAPLLVFALGLIAMRHVWRHFRSGASRGRRTGLGNVLLATSMVVSGYLIQVVTREPVLSVIAWIHIVAGVLFAAVVMGHWWAVGGSDDR